jgi:hypothetical protein
VGSSCEFGIEFSGSVKCWETIECPNIGDISSSAQLHKVSYYFIFYIRKSLHSFTPSFFKIIFNIILPYFPTPLK